MPAGMRVPNAHQLMFMPQWDPNAESLVTGPSQDDHDGGPAAGVASGFDPSGGEPCYQFGNQWVCIPPPFTCGCRTRTLFKNNSDLLHATREIASARL